MSSARPWIDVDQIAVPFLERVWPQEGAWDDFLRRTGSRLRPAALGARARRDAVVRGALRRARALESVTDAELRARADALRPALMRDGLGVAALAEAFALTREACGRVLGMRHFPVQLLAGREIIAGRIAEMATGEGKTITALLPAAAAALAGVPVHVVTVNDYLAERDAAHLSPVYGLLGLSVALVRDGMRPETRRAAYAADIVYGTNKEIAFDYLRDRLALGRTPEAARRLVRGLDAEAGPRGEPVMRGLGFAVVDEADSVLIDEAQTPLIISGSAGTAEDSALRQLALSVARGLQAGRDFEIDGPGRGVTLTAAGGRRVAAATEAADGLWRSGRARQDLVREALYALHMLHRDLHYILADGKVQIVDEFTGRVMPDRQWRGGLHQFVETKEGLAVSEAKVTLAQITYQRLFRRYLWIGGMTGTAAEVSRELGDVYDTRVVRIPKNRRERRRFRGIRLYRSQAAKWRAVIRAAERMIARGRPVLIGTRSVEASETVAAHLSKRGVPFTVLNARQTADEAAVVAGAGERAQVTVATNMAGRGTDIKLSDEVRRLGGLHVILTEFHESGRIDRQLYGRAGRQGDPGSCEAIVALDDDLLRRFAGPLAGAAALLPSWGGRLPSRAGEMLQAVAQKAAGFRSYRQRLLTLREGDRFDRALGFAAPPG